MRVLILTYHAIERGPTPLCVDPDLFARHVDAVVASGARVLTVSQACAELRAPSSSEPIVVFTFDDGFESVARAAAPVLGAHGIAATVFCVAGHVGGLNDWSSDRSGGHRSRLATVEQLRDLVAAGIEVGSHGSSHLPASLAGIREIGDEVHASQASLEGLLGTRVRAFAYPYGARPSPEYSLAVRSTYDSACTTRLGYAASDADVFSLPRVEAHYLRRVELLQRAVDGKLGPYLAVRRVAARARRAVYPDFRETTRHAAGVARVPGPTP
jgi:peptidoglycan/xylan/chitin deacetylase (PgdA/CDA1 family)